jgi:hypothetical protein
MPRAFHLLLALLLALPAFAQTEPPSTDCAAYASVPLPAEAQNIPTPKTFPACASYRSYRGIGRPVNYAQARACAWRERLAQQAQLAQNQQEPTAWVVGGSLILADIYFNGAGVRRNIPLALRLACEAEPAMAEMGMPDIAKSGGSLPSHGLFEFCTYAATTFTMNFCGGYQSEVDNDRKARFYKSVEKTMTPPQRASFEKLLAAEKAYVDKHALEVDQGGSIRDIRTMGSEETLNNLFHTEIVHFERKQWPALSANQIAHAETALRAEYETKLKQLRTRTHEEEEEGAVTAENVAKVERQWGLYRDAWAAFARLRYPAAAPAIVGEITLRRYRLLKTIN